MEFDPMVPIWLQIAMRLKQEMANGTRSPGEKLPGTRDLAITYGINPNTAARVYQEMERQGLCETRRGTGTFVTQDEARIWQLRHEMARQTIKRFLEEMTGLGLSRKDAINMLEEDTNDTEK